MERMFSFMLRTIWRLLIFALIVGLAYATSFIVLPYLDRRLPIFWAILLAYLFLAYVGLPFAIRLWQFVFKPDHIPRYVTTPDGWAADPVNIAVVAKDEKHLVRAMTKAGWYGADKSTLKNTLREAYAILLDKPYPTAPFSALYLFGRRFDVGFQIPYGRNKSPRHRHHVRFWQLVETPRTVDTHDHFSYWLRRVKRFFSKKRTVWIGAAIDDVRATGIRWRNLQITHANHPAHNLERDYIIETLDKAGLIKNITDIKDGEPFKMRSQNIGTSFVVDGYIRVVVLKKC